MASLVQILRRALWTLLAVVTLYGVSVALLTRSTIQRHALYAHKINTVWLQDINKPEKFGFAKNQITPFNFTTPDNEVLYAWHVMPLGLYAKHEVDILMQPSGCAEDITKTKAMELLNDPQARLIINFHGNAGTVAQGWRPDMYRTLSDGDTSRIHILAVDYRGFGYSTGFPTEDGLITDGIATVNWALHVAKIPSNRIVIIGHSLGTAVSCAVAEHFAKLGIEFAGVILISAFSDLSTLLSNYMIGGWIPVLSPLQWLSTVQKWVKGFIADKWPSIDRLQNFVRISQRVRLFIIHARDDYEIPWTHSEALFTAAANATLSEEMEPSLLTKTKARGTIQMGDGAFISTWKPSPEKIIREMILAHGGHNRVMTFAPIALAALKAFDLDDNVFLVQ